MKTSFGITHRPNHTDILVVIMSSIAVSALFTLSTLTLLPSSGNCLEIPKWSDIFSALQPYKSEQDRMLEEVDENGEPRLGFVQLNSGTTTFNATLNLTGHILLGLGIASSLLLYMFFNAFDTVGGGDDYGFASKNKRDTSSYLDIITVLDEAIQSHTGGSADANQCADKFLCQVLSEGMENVSTSQNSLRSFLWKKLSSANNDVFDSWLKNSGQREICQGFSTKCFLDPYEIKAVLDSPLSEWQ